MEGVRYEAEKLGVDPAWLLARMTPIGIGRCPACWPDHDIPVEGNYIEPCEEHSGVRGSLASPDDRKVTARPIEISDSARYV